LTKRVVENPQSRIEIGEDRVPKIKTHKATAKRFKVTARGKVMRTHIGKSHLRRRKAKRNKRAFDRRVEYENFERAKKVKQLAPTLD
jgi:large subunit ribosomal protein L35